MKPQSLKKLFAYLRGSQAFIVSLVGMIMFSTVTQSANAQYVEGPPKPGYICRCGITGYGCAGSLACRSRCSVACHRNSLTEISPDSILTSKGDSAVVIEPEAQKKIHQLEWETPNEEMNTPIPISNRLNFSLKK